MANLDKTQSRIIPQHKTEAEWSAWLQETGNENFCPKPGEIIIFDPDDDYNYSRFKVGDGQHNLSDLEFSSGAANGEGKNSLQVGEVGTFATKAEGNYSLAVGYSHTINPTITKGTGSVAIGKGNVTYGKQSAAFGCYSITGDKNGTKWNAEGEPFAGTDTAGEDLGKNSLAAGYNNNAWGESTTTLGTSNFAKGKASLAGGAENETYSYSSIALGYKNKVGNQNEDFYGHTKGADGSSAGAIAIGNSNIVKHQNSIALGYNLISANSQQIILGNNNKEDTEAVFILGNKSNNERHNTVSIYNDKFILSPTASLIKTPEKIFEESSNNYDNQSHVNRFVVKFTDKAPIDDWTEKIKKGQKYFFKFDDGNFYESTINEVWTNNFNPGIDNLYAFGIETTNEISYSKMTEKNLTFLGIYSIKTTQSEVIINSNGNILIPNDIQEDTTPNRLITYQELNNKNNLLNKIIVSGENIEINGDLNVNFDEKSLSFSLTDFDSIGGEK